MINRDEIEAGDKCFTRDGGCLVAREALVYVEANYDGMNKADIPMKALAAIDNVMKGE